MSCVNVERSNVELSGCTVTSLPSLGRRITLKVILRFECLLLSLVTACKFSVLIGVEEPECEEDKGSVKPINEWNLLHLDI